MNWIYLCISSTFFTGFLPGKMIGKPGVGGGLAGSIVGLLFLIYFSFLEYSAQTIMFYIIGSFVLGIVVVDKAEKFMLLKWGRLKRHTGDVVDHDFNQTNIDEVHGQFIAGLPVFIFADQVVGYQSVMLILSFFLFRLFDVIKPWPIKNVENSLKGGWSVMTDDTVAGIMAAILMFVVVVVVK